MAILCFLPFYENNPGYKEPEVSFWGKNESSFCLWFMY
jgi:hypothetical protein